MRRRSRTWSRTREAEGARLAAVLGELLQARPGRSRPSPRAPRRSPRSSRRSSTAGSRRSSARRERSTRARSSARWRCSPTAPTSPRSWRGWRATSRGSGRPWPGKDADRPAARLPRPGDGARGEHDRLEEPGRRDRTHVIELKTDDREAARAGAEPRMTASATPRKDAASWRARGDLRALGLGQDDRWRRGSRKTRGSTSRSLRRRVRRGPARSTASTTSS